MAAVPIRAALEASRPYGSQAGEEKLPLGRADSVARLRARVSTWVCFN